MVIPDYAKVGPIAGATTLKLVPSDGATKVMLSGKRAAARFMLARELAGVKHDPLVKETHYRLDRALTRPWPAGGEEALEFLRAAALDTRFDESAAAALSEKMAVVQARYSRWLPVEDDDGNLTWDFDPGTVDPAMVAQAKADLTELGWDKHLFPFAFADAAEILTKRDALVATFMGYGKSRAAIAVTEVFRWREQSQSPTIILALKRHLGAWREELGGVPEMPPCELITMQYGRDCYEEWTESGHQPTFQKPFLLLSLERLRLLKADELARLQIVARGSSLILDEAYVVANMDSKLSRALAQLEGAHHLALSGTPVRSYIDQLLNILMWTLRGGSISLPEYPREAGSRQRWNAQFLSYAVAEGGGSRKKIPFIRNQEALNDLLAPLMKRRLRNEPEVVKILGEANIIPIRLPVDLDLQHRDNYRAVLQEFTDWYTRELEVRGKPGAFPANELLVKLGFLVWNVAAPWRMEDHSDEQFTFPAYPEQPTAVHLEAMRIAQEELEEGNRVIVAGRSTLALDMIARELRARDVRVGLIHGGIPDEKRRLVIAQARRGEIEVLVGSSGVIAEGLNLNFANRMIVTEYTWDPATLAQLMARITRGVQTSAPKAYLLYARGTIQEYMLALMESKKDGASAALDRTRQDTDSPIPDIHVYAHSLAGIEGEDQVEARVYYLDESA